MPEEEVIDGDVIDEETSSQELVPTGGGAPATLFRTDDPVEIIERASAVASALSDVLKQKNLTTRIGQKDHVQVEGWTLCGAMLGVFPVVEWTRKLENGWEARVEARTKDGSVVGAAEAECLNTETRWRTADDYAIRSMAQTRAISKALRAPLGFVVHLAGFAATPLEEMVTGEPRASRPFDPETDLAAGAISGEDAPRLIGGALNELDPTVDWKFLTADVTAATYGAASWRELGAEDMQDFWRRLSNATSRLQDEHPPGSFPPPDGEKIQAAIAYAFSGLAIEVPYVEPEEVAEDDVPLAGEAKPEVEDIPFGE